MHGVSLEAPVLVELAAEVLARGGVFCFQTRGASMKPFLGEGTFLYLASTEGGLVRVGDVVLYRRGEGAAVHRIVGKKKGCDRTELFIRGDADMGLPEKVFLDEIVGLVVRAEQGGKTIRLDRGLWRWMGILWMRFTPLGQLVMRWGVTMGKGNRSPGKL